MSEAERRETLSGGVAVLFLAQVFSAGLGILNGILLARVLGPVGKGEYFLLLLVPTTTMVILQLGLPSAFEYSAARSQTRSAVQKALVLTGVLTLGAGVSVVAALPTLRETVLGGAPTELILLGFLALPPMLFTTMATSIMIGRKRLVWPVSVGIGATVATGILLVIVLVGIAPTVAGAVAVFVTIALLAGAANLVGALRVTRDVPDPGPVGYRELLTYGARAYPATLSTFFSYRVDAYILAFLMVGAAELGFYSMSVGLAEMALFFPNAVSALFFPHVAGSSREDSNRQVPVVSRVTLLVTTAVALLAVPAGAVLLTVVLPAFQASFGPFLILLPGVVALSSARVVSGYLTGIGRPGIPSLLSVIALAVNVVANLLLIPRLGIVGAATASLISYVLYALLLTAAAARLSTVRGLDFWVPRLDDLRFAIMTTSGLMRRAITATRGSS